MFVLMFTTIIPILTFLTILTQQILSRNLKKNINPEQLGEMASMPITPGYNTKTVIKQIQEDTSKVKIVKDFFYTMNGRYEEVIEKDSVNIFLVRDPRYVFTSFLPVSKTTFYSVS